MASNNTLAPPTLQLDTVVRRDSPEDPDAITPSGRSTISNPFLTPAVSSASSILIQDAETALAADPGTEADFHVSDNPFAFTPGQLNKTLNPKSLSAFSALGGLRGIAKGLQTDINSGLSVDETEARCRVTFEEATGNKSYAYPAPKTKVTNQHNAAPSKASSAYADRIRVFGRNVLPPKQATPLWKLMWNAYNDKVLILLTIAAVISLSLGLYETLGVPHVEGGPPRLDWVEGLAICVAIIIVTAVASLNDWQKERAFVRLNAKKDDREVRVTRSGKSELISVHDVLVGDVLHLEPGDLVPVDGVFIDGHDLKCDESSATGESDALRKTGGEQVMHAIQSSPSHASAELDPFIISGAKVLEGVGTCLVTSVGTNSSFGKIMMSVRTEMEQTPLQKKLEKLAVAIAYLGAGAAGLLFFVLLFRFVASLPGHAGSPAEKASDFLDILIVAVTVVVVAVPEGLPLAVTLALAFATTRLLKENNLVRVLRACETMGNATTICSDKTGTLTTNRMTVVAGKFGDASFSKAGSEKGAAQMAASLPKEAKELILQSIAINSTAFEGKEDGVAGFVGSKTETALLQFAQDHLGLGSLAETRANATIVQFMPFDSGKKCMAAVMRLSNGTYRLLVKGASEILLEYCTRQVDIHTLEAISMTDAARNLLKTTITEYAQQSLRTIALIYCDYEQWPPKHLANTEGHVDLGDVLQNQVFLGVVGIQDPVRPGVPEAVRKAQHAGVVVRMVTGDNAITAQAIAQECGIYTDGTVMEGPRFRTLSDEQMLQVLPKLQVLARSSPEDKRVLVTKLKELGETVAVTGDGTNDAPALKAADVGFSMGISGTEVAKEASAIVLMDDNFASIVTALKWGRAVNDAVQKFLQFQITVNITAVLLAFITAVSSLEMHSVLTAVQLLWVNLIMDTFAALALATDPPTERILDRKPQPKSAPLITTNMWKMIIGQAIFQLTVTLILHFAGARILGYDTNNRDRMVELDTMVFNTFVWMQIFNEFNNRRLDNKFNIFEGVHRNKFFIIINIIMVGAQVGIILGAGIVFSTKPIDATQWAICVVLALLSLPWAVCIRLFPDSWFSRIAKVVGKPFVMVYGAASRVFSRIGKMMRRKKTGEDEKEDAQAQVVGGPEIIISDDTPSRDVEKAVVP